MVLNFFIFYCLYIIISILLNFVKSAKHPSFSFVPNDRNQIITTIKLGTPPQEFTVLIDTASVYLWLYDIDSTAFPSENKRKFNKSLSSSYEDFNCSIKSLATKYNVYGYCGNDTLQLFNNIKIDHFSFYIVQTSDDSIPDLESIDGVLGIGFNYEDYKNGLIYFSIMEKFYYKNLISKKYFDIKFYNEKKGIVDFGEHAEDFSELYNATCKPLKEVKSDQPAKWACICTKIQVGIIKKKIDTFNQSPRIIFDTAIDYSIVSVDFFKFLKTTILKDLYRNNICYDFAESLYLTTVCNSKLDLGNVKNIYFYFTNNYALMYNPINMFKYNKDTDSYTFKIKADSSIDYWVVGQPFLKNFLMTFDKSKELVGFSSRDYLINLDIKYLTIFGYVSCTGIVVAIIIIGMYHIFLCVSRKLHLRFEDRRLTIKKIKETDESNNENGLGETSMVRDSLLEQISENFSENPSIFSNSVNNNEKKEEEYDNEIKI